MLRLRGILGGALPLLLPQGAVGYRACTIGPVRSKFAINPVFGHIFEMGGAFFFAESDEREVGATQTDALVSYFCGMWHKSYALPPWKGLGAKKIEGLALGFSYDSRNKTAISRVILRL